MRSLFAIPLGLAVACTPLAAGSNVEGIDRLAWLEGTWTHEEGGRWTEERWSDVKGASMIGSGRSGAGERLASFEYLRIVTQSDGRVTYLASPGGSEPTPFTMQETTGNAAVFENAAHDFPQRISYAREGDTLSVEISLVDGSRAIAWTMQRED